MLLDNRKENNTYEYSLIQFRNMWTKEIINIGIILSNKSQHYLHLPRSFDKLKNCLDFTEIAGLNYTLDIIIDRIQNQKRIPYGDISNSIFITESKSILSQLAAEDALHETVQKFMMVSKLREMDNANANKGKYDKLDILNTITNEAKKRHLDNYRPHRRYENIAKKIIDVALVDDQQEPYIVANIASLHKENFDDSFISASFTIQEAKRSGIIKDQFLYVPKMKDILTTKENRNLDWAKSHAHDIGVDIITDPRNEALFERLLEYS